MKTYAGGGKVQLHSFLRGFGFPLQSTRDLHSSGILRSVEW